MNRQRTIGIGALFVIVVAVGALWARIPLERPVAAAAAPSATEDTVPAPPAPAPETANAALLDLTPDAPADPSPSEGFDVLPDGKRAPPLPDSAPKEVGFGVVIVGYKGAQLAPTSSPTKEQAREKAQSLIDEAKRDFSAAVAKGDRGSTSNAGRVPRGILESAPEYVLFTLHKGEVADAPVDTPRGYWILRRVD